VSTTISQKRDAQGTGHQGAKDGNGSEGSGSGVCRGKGDGGGVCYSEGRDDGDDDDDDDDDGDGGNDGCGDVSRGCVLEREYLPVTSRPVILT